MRHIVNQIHKLLIKTRKTVSVAESCTGGIVSAFFTKTPGSSAYFLLGVSAYSNKSKENILKIPRSSIVKNGAVSETIAILMAQNIRRIASADLGIGLTGIAGPTGGTITKPVGTVFIAVSNKNKTICKKFIFQGSRDAIRKQAALKSMFLIKKFT